MSLGQRGSARSSVSCVPDDAKKSRGLSIAASESAAAALVDTHAGTTMRCHGTSCISGLAISPAAEKDCHDREGGPRQDGGARHRQEASQEREAGRHENGRANVGTAGTKGEGGGRRRVEIK